ncbi:MAG: ATP-binding cassette domain-containing protein [Patescibacteria group bacterium]
MSKVIRVESLTKKFGDLTAVNNISFEVSKGEIFGILGPNGAGKTTCLEIIEGIQKPTSGRTFVLDLDTHEHLDKVKAKIGVQLQASSYFDNLNLKEILELFGSFYGLKVDADKLLDIVSLSEKKKALVRQLSGGQKQRFSICATLVNDPEIVFLDEPTTGLDPQAKHNIWDFIRKINDQGKTIVLTTHYMEEAQILCDRVAIMDLGQIAAMDTPVNLIHNLKASSVINFTSDCEVCLENLKEIPGVFEVERGSNHSYNLKVSRGSEVLPQIIALAHKNKFKITDEEILHANLEDVFLELTGKKLRE